MVIKKDSDSKKGKIVWDTIGTTNGVCKLQAPERWPEAPPPKVNENIQTQSIPDNESSNTNSNNSEQTEKTESDE